jgi:recombinational DNA repair ATPase RecF
VLLSPNGTGKTTVLEAVYALATATSFRTGSGERPDPNRRERE